MLDGKSNRGNLQSAVPQLKNTTIQVYAVGIERIKESELQYIASDPDDDYVFLLASYSAAAGFADYLSVAICNSKSSIYFSNVKKMTLKFQSVSPSMGFFMVGKIS